MQSFGRVVEKLGQTSKKSKGLPGAPHPSSAAPPSSIPLGPFEGRIRKVLESLEAKEVVSLIPNLSGKRALHATASTAHQWEALQQKGAKLILDLDVGTVEIPGSTSPVKPVGLQRSKGSLAEAPFRDESFEFLVFLGTGIRREDPIPWMNEMARILKDGSRVVLSFTHPYLEHLLNPAAGFPHGIAQYYMALRRAGIYVEEIKEALADETVRSFFGPTKDDTAFLQIRGCPMVVFFKAIRLKKR